MGSGLRLTDWPGPALVVPNVVALRHHEGSVLQPMHHNAYASVVVKPRTKLSYIAPLAPRSSRNEHRRTGSPARMVAIAWLPLNHWATGGCVRRRASATSASSRVPCTYLETRRRFPLTGSRPTSTSTRHTSSRTANTPPLPLRLGRRAGAEAPAVTVWTPTTPPLLGGSQRLATRNMASDLGFSGGERRE